VRSKYKTVKVVPEDISARAFYSGRYSGYSDEELEEVIGTGLFEPDQRTRLFKTANSREKNIFHGKLIHYRDVDRTLDLPPGTAKRLLEKVAEEYGAVSDWEGEHCVRFREAGSPPEPDTEK
jgi:hypothetical protein